MRRASDVPREFGARRVAFRFDPTTETGRLAVDVATDVLRLVLDDRDVPAELRKRWYRVAYRAAFHDRKRRASYAAHSGGVGDAERVERVAAGCMRLAAARLAAERSVP